MEEPEFRAFDIPFDHRVERFAEALQIVRPLLDGERVTFAGDYETASDAVLLPTPERRPPLMVGPPGRVYGNTPEGFAELNRRVDGAARAARRDPSEIERSACALVVLDRAAGERPIPEGMAAVEDDVAGHLRELAEAGADEAILVVSPIDERSIRALGETLAALDRGD